MSIQQDAPAIVEDEKDTGLVAKSLDYEIVATTAPKYKMSLLVPQQGQSNNIVPASTSISMIELPAYKVFNLAETVLSFTVTAGRSGVGNSANWVYADKASMISRIQLYTRGGVQIVDIPYASKYLEVVQKVNHTTEGFLNRSLNEFYYPNNGLALDSFRPATSVTGQIAGVPSAKAYIEPRYVLSSGLNVQAADLPQIAYQLRLGDIPECFFSIDKDVCFPEVTILSVEWARGSDYLWYTTGADNNAANNNPAGVISSVAYASNSGTISNINLYLAMESDFDIAQMVISKLRSQGMEILTSFPYVFYNQINASPSHSISLRLSSGNGITLSKIYSAPFNNDQTRHLAFDHSNINGSKVSSYYTMMDNLRTTEFNVTCTNDAPLDYLQNKAILRYTPIADINVYRYNWFLCDDFSKDRETGNDANAIGGLELTNTERKWDLIATTTGAVPYNWYTFAITKRKVIISTQGVMIQ